MTTQDQTQDKNYNKTEVNKTSNELNYRLCKERDETVNRLISEFSKFVPTEYKQQHDKCSDKLQQYIRVDARSINHHSLKSSTSTESMR